MSGGPSTNQRLAGPRHLVAGTLRKRNEQITVALAVTPTVVVVLATLLLLFAPVWELSLWLLAWAVLAWFVPAVVSHVRWAYWRTKWYWDARAAGLAVEAEPSMFARTDKLTDAHIVVVPTVRVRMLANGGREYRCRPLPGQTRSDYDVAVARLEMRWRAIGVSIDSEPGAKYVVMTVHRHAPEVQTYTRAA